MAWSLKRTRRRRGCRRRARVAQCENLEARYLLTGTGFEGNACPPDLDLSGIDDQTAVVGQQFALDLGALDVVTDVDADGNPTGDVIRFVLDPDVPEETPLGASITPEGLFTWTPTDTQVGTFEIVVIAIDSGNPALADAETFRIEVVPPQNVAPVIDLNGDDPGDGFSTTLNEEDGVVSIVDVDLSITDADDDMLSSASAVITNLQDGADEFLTVATEGTNIIAAYDPTTGVLTMTGLDTLENYQTVLRSLQYGNTSDDPSDVQRQVDLVVNDGEDDSNVASALITIVPFNDAPDIQAIDDAVAFVGIPFEITITVTDPDSTNITLLLDDDAPENAELIPVDETTWLIRWTPTEADGEGPFTFRVNATDDGALTGADSESFLVTLGNPLAVADLNGAAEGLDISVSFVEGEGAIPIFADDLSISDPTDTELEGATISITNLMDGNDEALTFDTTGIAITGTYDPTTGVLTFTGTDTIANYETVLRSVRYENFSENPTEVDRIVEVSLDDGTDVGPVSTSTVSVTGVNDSPDLTLPGVFGDPETPVEIQLGETISFSATVDDPDAEPGELTFMLDLDNSGIGEGELLPTIDQSGAFNWTPSEVGCFMITVIVTDGAGAADQETFLVLVNEAPSQNASADAVPDLVGADEQFVSIVEDAVDTSAESPTSTVASAAAEAIFAEPYSMSGEPRINGSPRVPTIEPPGPEQQGEAAPTLVTRSPLGLQIDRSASAQIESDEQELRADNMEIGLQLAALDLVFAEQISKQTGGLGEISPRELR